MLKNWLFAFCLGLLAAFAQAQTRDLPDFADLAEKQGVAVVNISATQVLRGHPRIGGFPFDEDDRVGRPSRRHRRPILLQSQFQGRALRRQREVAPAPDGMRQSNHP